MYFMKHSDIDYTTIKILKSSLKNLKLIHIEREDDTYDDTLEFLFKKYGGLKYV